MTTDHQLPQIFGRVSKKGVPYVAVIAAWLFGPLAYLSKYTYALTEHLGFLTNLRFRSWKWWCRAGLYLAAQPQHRRGFDRLGHSLLLLHPFPRRYEGPGSFTGLASLEGTLPAICRLGWFHWFHHHHSGGWLPCLPEGQLERL